MGNSRYKETSSSSAEQYLIPGIRFDVTDVINVADVIDVTDGKDAVECRKCRGFREFPALKVLFPE